MAENYTPRVKAILRKHGCTFVRQGKGDHEIWQSPINKRLQVHGRQQDQITRLGQHNIEEGGDSKGLLRPGPRRGKCGCERAVECADRAIAHGDGRTYERNFRVITGVDGEVEVEVLAR
jgi:hypothetical protein